MEELDKDKHLARFPRVISVANVCVIAAITAGIGQLLGSRFLAYQIPLWLVILLVLIILSTVNIAPRQRQVNQHPTQSRQVFFLLCAFTEKRWVAGLIQDLHKALDSYRFELVLKIPERDYVCSGQIRHLRNLSERGDAYAGGIISAAEPELLRDDLKSFCATVRYPIIFVDIDPFGAIEEYPDSTAFVGYAPDVIGCCAADYVSEHAAKSQITSPRVLVIGSNRLHIGRQAEFIKRLKLRVQDAEFILDQSGDFNRTCAREIAYENLRSEQDAIPNYIFCTNDEMALGAVDALSLTGLGNDGSVVVVGVDGIPEARALIDSQNTPLRATIVQDSCRVAEKATELLDKAIRGEPVARYNYMDNPQIYSKDR